MKESSSNFSKKVRCTREKRRNLKEKKNKSLYLTNLVSGELKLKLQFDTCARKFKEHCQYWMCL